MNIRRSLHFKPQTTTNVETAPLILPGGLPLTYACANRHFPQCVSLAVNVLNL